LKLFAYTMTWDTGFAPSVSRQLSLACCKSNMRYTIAKDFDEGDKDIYVIGLLGKSMARRKGLSDNYFYTPLYLAKISNIENVKDYYAYNSPERADKKYLYKNNNWYIRKGNPHHPKVTYENGLAELKEYEKEKDIMYLPRLNSIPRYNYVLLSDEFVYFGKEVIAKNEFDSFLIKYIAETRANSPMGNTITLTSKEQGELLNLFNELKNRNINPKHKPYDGYFESKDCKDVCGR